MLLHALLLEPLLATLLNALRADDLRLLLSLLRWLLIALLLTADARWLLIPLLLPAGA